MGRNKNWQADSERIWECLIAHKNRPLLFHSTVAQWTDVSTHNVHYPLAYILEFCERHHLPALSGAVIDKSLYYSQGLKIPGGLFRLRRQDRLYFPNHYQFDKLYHQEMEAVRATDWLSIQYKPCSYRYNELKLRLSLSKISSSTSQRNTTKGLYEHVRY